MCPLLGTKKERDMLRINFKKLVWGMMVAMAFSTVAVTTSSILFANEAQAQEGVRVRKGHTAEEKARRKAGKEKLKEKRKAATAAKKNSNKKSGGTMFGSLVSAGAKIFVGLRDIIFAASGIGIVAVAIGGFFGNLNWKWLAAIGIGLFVLSTTAALIDYMVGEDLKKSGVSDIQGSLKSGT